MKNCITSLLRFLLLLSPIAVSAQEAELFAQARAALEQGIPQVAIQMLGNAERWARADKESRATALRLMAQAQLAAGKPEDVLKLVALLDSADAEAQLLRAHALAAQSRWGEALAVYQATQARMPGAIAIMGEAECLQAMGRTPEAVKVLERFVASGRATTAVRLRLAALLVSVERGSEARAILLETPRGLATDELSRRYVEARILLSEGKPREALAQIEQVIGSDAGRPAGLSHNLLVASVLVEADARLALAGPEAAEKTLESFIRKTPLSPQIALIFRRLDQIYAIDKNPAEGPLHSMFRDFTGVAPTTAALAQFYVVRMQMRERRYDRASVSIETFLKKFPTHPLVSYLHEMRADIALAAGDLAEAERAFDAASVQAQSTEQRAGIALRTALVNLRQGEFVRATLHLDTARRVPALRQSASFNSALAWLMQKNHERFGEELRAFVAEFSAPLLVGHLRLEQGLVKARTGETDAPALLRSFLRDFPAHPRRAEAELAFAELALQQGRPHEASALVSTVAAAAPSSETAAQAAYLAVFAEDAKLPRNVDRVVTLAREFIARHGDSPLLAEVRMKLGQVQFHQENYLEAQEQFETLAREQPDGPYAEPALFLAAQSATRLINPDALNRALELFDNVAARRGPMEAYARLQQAQLKTKLGAEDDAVKIYDALLGSPVQPEPEVRYAALIGKAENLAILGKNDPKQYAAALATFDSLLALPDLPATWRNQAGYRRGRLLLQMGRPDDALAQFHEVLRQNGKGPRESFWMAKAGFDGAAILEARQQWKGVIGILEMMAKIPGAHVEQAKQRIKTLRQEHFIWE